MIEIIASFWENNPILGKFDLCWPPVTSILTSSKNDPYVFCRTWYSLSNAVYRFSMRCVVLEISRGVEINPPPVLVWLRPPPVRGLSICFVILSSIVSLSTASDIHELMALVPKSPIRHFQTISPFKGTDKFGRVTIFGSRACTGGFGSCSYWCYGPYQNSVSINTARAVLILTEGPVSIDAAREVLMLPGKPVSINTDRFARAVIILPTFSL